MLNVKFPSSPPDGGLDTVIIFGGPGSWKREAFWDEYVLTLRNQGEQPLTVAAAALTDYAGSSRAPGDDPWALERQSKDLERRYRDAGMSFARVAGPRILAATAEPGVIASAGIGSAGAAAAATTTAVALPIYGLTMLGINRHNKTEINAEFKRRSMPLPITLGPGESRSGSLFFPMTPNPRTLSLSWSSESGNGDAVLPLEFLRGIHVTADSAQEGRPSTASPTWSSK
jgi:hypothetical protein